MPWCFIVRPIGIYRPKLFIPNNSRTLFLFDDRPVLRIGSAAVKGDYLRRKADGLAR